LPVKELIEAMLLPVRSTAKDAMWYGSLIVPALEACLKLFKSKIPKKPNQEMKE